MTEPFDDLDLAALRRRSSAKWRRYGPDVLPAWVAEMDYPLADPIAELLRRMVADSDTGYGWPDDLPEAFSAYCRREQGWQPDPARVLLTGDVLSGIAAVLRALTEPGDGVVITTPVYPPFASTVRDVTGRRLVDVPLRRGDAGHALDLDALAAAFARPDVTAFLLCSPHNPTGTVFSTEDLTAVAELAVRHGVTVVADEVHSPLVLPGAAHQPYLGLPEELSGPAVLVTSASKSFNIPGLKCAQVVAGSAALAATLDRRIPIEVRIGAGLLGIRAQAVAYREGGPWLRRVHATLDRNRTLLAGLLADRLPGVGYRPPEASFLAWLDFRGVGLGDDPAATLLDRGRVALSPGPDFGPGGVGFARLNIGTSAAILTELVDRMAAAMPGR